MRLDFVCIGAQKAGTTTLHDIIKDHPDIYLPETKEAHFFDVNEKFQKGLDFFFKNYYKDYVGEKIVGNINPNLQVETRSIDRLIQSFGKDLKFIFILRDPVKRAYSHYLMSHRRCLENKSFIEALEIEEFRIANPKRHFDYESNEPGHFEKNNFGYISRSIYSKTLKHLDNKVPNNNIKLIFFEDLIKNTETEIENIFQFLNVSHTENLDFGTLSNSATGIKNRKLEEILSKPGRVKHYLKRSEVLSKISRPILSKLRQINRKELDPKSKILSNTDAIYAYENFFKEEIDKLEKLTKRDLSHWRYS
ncbi:sulfotransferase family protein [Salinimicrobium sp. TH3]|uniref:sulfotransferase family protein n=1 Tax=Salinimicrobium sp. TH3 TaxID=2997342 RepID=UPI002273497A|nr:sulfotransferase [Salinimicrobium sp. TH3]MCY2687800.1 sulfotransferase [Salinimicrobium sp. TH3]